MSFNDKIESIMRRYEELEKQLQDPSAMDQQEFIKISKEYSDLGDVVAKMKEYKELEGYIEELEESLKDPEMKELAEEEKYNSEKRLEELEEQIKIELLPKDIADEKNAILEIRAGTGGDEAAIFAGDLLTMYQRYADHMGWKFEIMSASDSDSGGFKEIVCNISGDNVFRRLKGSACPCNRSRRKNSYISGNGCGASRS